MHDSRSQARHRRAGPRFGLAGGGVAALKVLDEATDDEYANAANPESLLADIKRTQLRLRTRVRGLRMQYSHFRQAIAWIRAELDKPEGEGTDFANVRQRLAWLLTALRHQRARESDLIYEAYHDAFDTELTKTPTRLPSLRPNEPAPH